MLEWVTAEQRRLRLLMAELHQIACRGTSRFLAGPRFAKAEAAELAKLTCMPGGDSGPELVPITSLIPKLPSSQ